METSKNNNKNMKRVYVTTLKRRENPKLGETGHLYGIDWESKELIFKEDKSVVDAEVIERGTHRSHGLRGLDMTDNLLFIADSLGYIHTYDVDKQVWVSIYDYREQLSNRKGQFVGVHQIRFDSYDRLWIACANSDKLGCLNLVNTEKLETYDLFEIHKEVDPYVRSNNPWGEDRLHFNSIGFDQNGKQYHVYYNVNMIFNWTDKEIFYQHKDLIQLHDICFYDDGHTAITNSSGNALYQIYKKHQKERVSLPKIIGSNEVSTLGYNRGVAIVDGGYFICFSPGFIRFYFGTLDPYEELVITLDPNETIYDICLDKRDWIE